MNKHRQAVTACWWNLLEAGDAVAETNMKQQIRHQKFLRMGIQVIMVGEYEETLTDSYTH